MKFKITAQQIILYVKIALILGLIAIEVVVCAQAYGDDVNIGAYIALVVCCAVLALIETVNTFAINNFTAKMVFYAIDSVLLLTVDVLTGNTYLAVLYCIVLTGCYMNVEKFKDRTVLFGVSCGLFTISFIVGGVLVNSGALAVVSGTLFGLLAIILDYIVVQFLLKFYSNNLELRAALHEADESKARLRQAYEQLTLTKVYEERNRIAKDIHDNAGHSMTTVIMQTEAAKLLIDENPAEAKNRIISANIQARNALEQMRQSVHLLAGREETRTLREELEEIIAQTFDGTGVKARYDLADVHPTKEQYRFICNSVKELLANGIRHGRATAFYIELKEVFGNIELLVSDNGSGVNGVISEGFGLRGIREKAEALGGKCVYSSEEGEGFETEITLPINKTAQAEGDKND